MPCCGLTEPRRQAPLRYTLAGALVFWGGFGLLLGWGAATSWRPSGRRILRSAGAFLAALWRETMRNPASVPGRWACRLSGRLIPVSPALAGWVFRHPEAPLFLVVAVAGGGLVGVVWLCSFWV